MLKQKTLDDAIEFISTVKHASGECYTFGDSDRVVCYEGSANSIVPFSPSSETGRVYHTNHPLASDDVWVDYDDPVGVTQETREAMAISIKNSRTRYAALERRLDDPTMPVTLETATAILDSHDSSEFPVCRHDESGNITSYSMIMLLSDRPELHVAPGPPCKTGFETYTF
jgi:hypothetical protein